MNAQNAAIHLDSVSKTFRTGFRRRRTQALRGLSLRITPGEIVGFIGPNGAGKTTAIKILMGLLRPDKGKAFVFGTPVGRVESRSRLAYQPELPDFYEFMTASELLFHCGQLAGLPQPDLRSRIPGLLERVGLEPHTKKHIGKFSRGMRQRVGIAQAMLADPDLFILDEPMGGLDPIGRRWMKDLILELGRAGKTVFFSSHVLAEAEAVCDRVAFIHRGRLLAQGPLAQVLASRDNRWEIVVEGDQARSDDSVAGLASGMEAAGADTLLFSDAPQPDDLLAYLLERKYRILSVNQRHASLEDVFLEALASQANQENS